METANMAPADDWAEGQELFYYFQFVVDSIQPFARGESRLEQDMSQVDIFRRVSKILIDTFPKPEREAAREEANEHIRFLLSLVARHNPCRDLSEMENSDVRGRNEGGILVS